MQSRECEGLGGHDMWESELRWKRWKCMNFLFVPVAIRENRSDFWLHLLNILGLIKTGVLSKENECFPPSCPNLRTSQ
jgi:hypothetical protein